MTPPAFKRIGAFLAVTITTLSVLTACTGNNDQAAAEAYIRANITELSPTDAVLGGTFTVTDISWEDDDTAIISYEDGHIALKGRTDIQKIDDTVTVTTLVIVDTDTETDTSNGSASSIAVQPRAKEGEMCGGIAGIQCEPTLFCKYDGAYPDAGGICVQ